MFTVDARIENDSILIAELNLCQLRLQNDHRYPWLVLLPKVEGLTEVHELSTEQQALLLQESSKVAQALKQVTECKKINVANLGNVVAQLHWHIVARFEHDEAWPGPIWGVGSAIAWPEQKRADFVDSLLTALND